MLQILRLAILTLISLSSSLIAQDLPTTSPLKEEAIPPFPFPEEEVKGDDGHFTMQLLHMFLMLGLLIGLLLFTSWFLKRMMQSRIQQVNVNSAIRVLEQRAISTRTTVYALDIEGKTYILAETPTSITPLYPITEK